MELLSELTWRASQQAKGRLHLSWARDPSQPSSSPRQDHCRSVKLQFYTDVRSAHPAEALTLNLMSSSLQVIDNVAVEHSTKKQKSAQKAKLADEAPAKPAPAEAHPASGNGASKTQRRISPRQKSVDRTGAVKPGQEVVGKQVRVFWAADQAWYKGSLCEYSAASGKHLCEYDDGDREWLDLAAEQYELDEGMRAPCPCSTSRSPKTLSMAGCRLALQMTPLR